MDIGRRGGVRPRRPGRAGHEVTAITRTPGKVATLRAAGAEPLVLDGLDRGAVMAAVRAAARDKPTHSGAEEAARHQCDG